MAEIDRSKRYANPPKGKKSGAAPNKDEAAARKASETAERKEGEGKGPTPEKPGAVGKENEDKGPSRGESGPEFGVVAERHKREHADMHKRHEGDREAHHKGAGEMHARHDKEARDMHERHRNELLEAAGEGGAEGEAEKTAGKPRELGAEKAEGEKGSNV